MRKNYKTIVLSAIIGLSSLNVHSLPQKEAEDQVIFVAPDGSASANGSSWGNATTLANAVQVSGAQIWLKAGVYSLSATVTIDNANIYGGFAGTETELNGRNYYLHQSIIDGGGVCSPLRCSSVAAFIDGLVVQNGINSSANGGGMFLVNGSTVRNCIFRNNRTGGTYNGAAIHCNSGNITIENSLFVNNTSAANGGAVQVGGATTARIINCTFANNKSTTGPGGAIGTGNNTSNCTLINTIAYNNQYGSVYSSYGQNADVNGGGTIISNHSAIESTSTKFTEANDIEHLSLTREVSPEFVAPCSVIGYSNVPSEVEAINTASYELKINSPCINAGNTTLAQDITLDLSAKNRITGRRVDIGAYEYKHTSDLQQVFFVVPNGSATADGASWENATTLARSIFLSGLMALPRSVFKMK